MYVFKGILINLIHNYNLISIWKIITEFKWKFLDHVTISAFIYFTDEFAVSLKMLLLDKYVYDER